jgi:hypothetical protein
MNNVSRSPTIGYRPNSGCDELINNITTTENCTGQKEGIFTILETDGSVVVWSSADGGHWFDG